MHTNYIFPTGLVLASPLITYVSGEFSCSSTSLPLQDETKFIHSLITCSRVALTAALASVRVALARVVLTWVGRQVAWLRGRHFENIGFSDFFFHLPCSICVNHANILSRCQIKHAPKIIPSLRCNNIRVPNDKLKSLTCARMWKVWTSLRDWN
ncbi:hypothetical protein FA95DRAFT_646988 [Auriscalpium vulgare]|uniref:Uncharacterized protein n=1 Tax=Auriscalpium vulgare TaxID=40419 RepID=A0ACB8S1W8_9AGAM|nr:hypothetical protein FA95DRAFT_646988 [Auriscalpium vulgare]